MSSAPVMIRLPSGEQAWYMAGSGLSGHAHCVTVDGRLYDVQIPDELAAMWWWHGSVLVRVTGERLPTCEFPPPFCFQEARIIEQRYTTLALTEQIGAVSGHARKAAA